MKQGVDYRLYLVTDPDMPANRGLEETVRQAIQGGCTMVQLREKNVDGGEFYRRALAVKAVTDAANVPLIINDRIDVALAVDAAGVHVGQSDLPARVARRILGANKLLGVSASTLQEARTAAQDGADYLGLGAVFPTGTKADATTTSLQDLKRICTQLPIPVVAIGGIHLDTLPMLAGSGIAGVAVVSAIMAARDPQAAARQLLLASAL